MLINFSRWQFWGFVFVSALGTFMHFLFEISGGSPVVGIFAPVNESIWEHMKLIFYPMLVYAIIEYRAWGREAEGFWSIKLIGIALALVLIPVLYYLYSGILGRNLDFVNVIIFYVSAAAGFILETRLFDKGSFRILPPIMAVICLCVIAAFFTLFTFKAPELSIFRDPLSGSYGYISR